MVDTCGSWFLFKKQKAHTEESSLDSITLDSILLEWVGGLKDSWSILSQILSNQSESAVCIQKPSPPPLQRGVGSQSVN